MDILLFFKSISAFLIVVISDVLYKYGGHELAAVGDLTALDDLAPRQMAADGEMPDEDVPLGQFAVRESVAHVLVDDAFLQRAADLPQFDVEDAVLDEILDRIGQHREPLSRRQLQLVLPCQNPHPIVRETQECLRDVIAVFTEVILSDHRGGEKVLDERERDVLRPVDVELVLLLKKPHEDFEIVPDVNDLPQDLFIRLRAEYLLRRHLEQCVITLRDEILPLGLHLLIHACLPSGASAPCYRHTDQQARDATRPNEIREAIKYPPV